MNLETLLLVFVGISALAFVLQCLSMWTAARSIAKTVERLEQETKELQGDAHELIERAQGIVDSMAPLGRIAESLKANMDLISEMVKERAQDLDQFVQEMTEMGREQASKVNYVVTDTVEKFEQTTEMIHQDVLKPALEISSFLKGIKAGLSYLFNKKTPPPPSKSHPEEELFI